MSREEFIESHRHFFGGLVLDAATAQRTGADLALSIRTVMKRIDAELGKAFDSLKPAEKPPPPKGTK
jgi:hypothetical protein